MVVVAWAAAAFASSPATVRPSAKVTSAKVTGSTVHFVVEVTFAPPADSAAAKACKGKVEVSKAAKAASEGAALDRGAGTPRRKSAGPRVSGQLPADLFNDKVPFTISFDGNGAVAPFSKGASLKLSPPGGSGQVKGPPTPPSPPAPAGSGTGGPNGAVAYTAADGGWHAVAAGISTDFIVEGGVIKQHFSSTGNMMLKCDTYDGSAKENFLFEGFDYRQDLAIDPSGNFSGHYTHEFEQEFPETTIHLILPQTIHGHLGATTGEVIVDVAGASLSATGPEGHVQSGCSASVTLEAFKQP